MSNLRSHSKEISAIDRKGVSGRRKLKLKLKTSKISSKHKNIMKRAMYGPK